MTKYKSLSQKVKYNTSLVLKAFPIKWRLKILELAELYVLVSTGWVQSFYIQLHKIS